MHPPVGSPKNGYHWEGGRSGMDNTPRGKTTPHAIEERPNNSDMLWVDAICQQALSAGMISKLFEIMGDKALAKHWYERFSEKRKSLNSWGKGATPFAFQK